MVVVLVGDLQSYLHFPKKKVVFLQSVIGKTPYLIHKDIWEPDVPDWIPVEEEVAELVVLRDGDVDAAVVPRQPDGRFKADNLETNKKTGAFFHG